MTNAPINDLHTIRDWVRWGASEFNRAGLYFGHGTDNAWDEAVVLVLWALALPWDNLDHIYEARLTEDEKQRVVSLFQERIRRQLPAPYITGEAWFGGLRFVVTPDVLVPRSPVAELILAGIQPWMSEYPAHILDLCTGSGCIGILCASMFPDASVDLSDISSAAIAVARQNIQLHDLGDRVQAFESDLFNEEPIASRRYDLIIANPPYVDARDLASMPAEYHAEPVLGLAAGEDGLDIVRRILKEAANHLNPGGLLVIEVGNSWEALEEAYPEVQFMWPEFENGGHGVFLLSAEQLAEYGTLFAGH